MTAPVVLVAAGGTGGHVYPALAVATELSARGLHVEWIGTRRGLEHTVVSAAGIKLHYLPVRGLRGKSIFHKLAASFSLGLAMLQSISLLIRRAPRCVLGMGGYVAGPAGAAAWLLRKPLLIHEQNAVAGTTNRLLAPLASRVLAAFSGAFVGREVDAVLGNPIRKSLLEASAESEYTFSGQRPLRLLVLGGSLGAQAINEVLPATLLALREQHGEISLWHQTGEAHIAAVRSAYGALLGQDVRVDPFISDMAAAYGWADLVLCRAGALTVSELAVMGRPSILVPLPHAIDDHQTANASYLSGAGAARLLPQRDLTVEAVKSCISGLLSDPQLLASMAAAAREVAMPDAAERTADVCEELIYGR
ncbi:MAG: undecaprenyldiphospho-muramoylpentapeptide beta-N-acetylglucosaminyltransferase [Pseudomonadota bacterium]